MTTFLPLDGSASIPPSPAFLIPSSHPDGHIRRAVNSILKARRIAVVCGAGISVDAGIPDFRSSDGLFRSLRKGYPTLASGKDLFDVSVFKSEESTLLFCQTVARLSQLSEAAEPTEFHRLLRVLDDRHHLLRVYTQNIDALEKKAGLTFGIPELGAKPTRRPSNKGKGSALESLSVEAPSPITLCDKPLKSRLPSSRAETPKCIPLHGTLQQVYCMACAQSYPLRNYLDSLVSGRCPECPECTALEQTRRLIGKRPRPVGQLRPGLVLYNEAHKDEEELGHVIEKDLMGVGRAAPDLLLVVGTSLHVPGTKRIVREFSKAVRWQHPAPTNTPVKTPTMGSTPPSCLSAVDEELHMRTIYLNLDFPASTREWAGVFDVWIRGDVQDFARMVHQELEKEQENMVKKRKLRGRGGVVAEDLGVEDGKETTELHNSAMPDKKRRLAIPEDDVIGFPSVLPSP